MAKRIHTPKGQSTAYGHIQKARQIAMAEIADPKIKQAIMELSFGVSKMNSRERERAKIANALIAENMFAIVRLEIAHAADQIINAALAVKRTVTGSGKAEVALTVTGTLAMLAGNVLSGGGMTVIGNLIVSAGETAKAAAKNDFSGTLTGMSGMAAHGIGVGVDEQQQSGSSVPDTIGANTNEVSQGQWVGDSASKLYAAEIEILDTLFPDEESDDPEKYRVVKKKTAFIKHGAGGTHAITFDVQKAVTESYAIALDDITREMAALGKTKNLTKVGGVLGSILEASGNPKSTLHPVTVHVLKTALDILQSGGGEYDALTGGSGMFGRSSVLNDAKDKVKKGYRFMLADVNGEKGIPSAKSVLDQLK